jgi:hypothetical protein
MNDIQGRPWAKVSEVKNRSIVKMDDDFSCMMGGVNRIVQEDDGGLFVVCAEGHHYLNGQLSEDETHYVGVYHVQ